LGTNLCLNKIPLSKKYASDSMTYTILISTTKKLPNKTMMTEVMLDRWLLDQIEEEYDVIEVEKDMPVEELSHEVLELLS
jgi:hypothetical protein